MEKISGRVGEVSYRNPHTGYTVLEVICEQEVITVVGELGEIAPGETVEFTGKFTVHPTYGRQFRSSMVQQSIPQGAVAILAYLSSGVIKGLGKVLATRMVHRFGDETLLVIEKEPERLAEISGISPRKAAEIAQAYRKVFGLRTAMAYLSGFGLEAVTCIKVWKRWGALTQEQMEENPYALNHPDIGLDFEQTEEIAQRLAVGHQDPRRLIAGLCHVLRHNLSVGHTCLPREKLLSVCGLLLDLQDETELLAGALEELLAARDLMGFEFEGELFVCLPEMLEAERFISGRIAIMLETRPPSQVDVGDKLSRLEAELGIEFDSLQKKAVSFAFGCGVFILTGGPGTGKTTTLNAILALLEESGRKVALAAPTGRAAKRASEVTGRVATTIHRLLEVDFRENDRSLGFKRCEKNPLEAEVVVLDEASMVDTPLMHSLLKAMRMDCRLILLGDPDQLPSVGPGNILRDLIASQVIPTVHLSKIFRQAQDSLIVRNAHSIVNGEYPNLASRESDFFFMGRAGYNETAELVSELVAARLPGAYGYSPFADIQVIAPSRVGALGTTELNRILQARINPPAPDKAELKFYDKLFRTGDKVMQVKNNYDLPWSRESEGGDLLEEGSGVFNGDIGIIEEVSPGGQHMTIRFDEDKYATYITDNINELEHAYAITAHKSQGSEFEAVIIPLMNYHQKLYYRNILYTAVTRARKLLIIIGKRETIEHMVDNNRKILRYTTLEHLMREELGEG